MRFVDVKEAQEVVAVGDVIDTRGLSEYLAAHLEGAVHVPDSALRAGSAGVPATLHENELLAAIFGRVGIDRESPVLVYASREDPLSATLVAYALARLGHADVAVLEGGFEAWAANRAVTRSYPDVSPTVFVIEEPTLGAIEFGGFIETLGTDAHTFIDARPTRHYRGEVPFWSRNGHIPCAHSLPWTTMTHAGNPSRPLDEDAMREKLDALEVSEWDDIVVYCGTGREATLLMILLSCELGYPNVRLYEGSWTEYTQRDGARVETGDRVVPRTRVFRDGDFFIAGQPTEATFEELAERGVRTVVSCRTEREMGRLDFDQEELLEELGMTYRHIPMGGTEGYSPAQLRAFAQTIDACEGPVLVHCASGGRARLLWMGYLVDYAGVSPDEAWARSEAMGGQAWSFERLLGRPVRLTVEPASAAGTD